MSASDAEWVALIERWLQAHYCAVRDGSRLQAEQACILWHLVQAHPCGKVIE